MTEIRLLAIVYLGTIALACFVLTPTTCMSMRVQEATNSGFMRYHRRVLNCVEPLKEYWPCQLWQRVLRFVVSSLIETLCVRMIKDQQGFNYAASSDCSDPHFKNCPVLDNLDAPLMVRLSSRWIDEAGTFMCASRICHTGCLSLLYQVRNDEVFSPKSELELFDPEYVVCRNTNSSVKLNRKFCGHDNSLVDEFAPRL
jgi:hypothetical protein